MSKDFFKLTNQNKQPLQLNCHFFDPSTDIVMYLMVDSVSSQIFLPLIPVLLAKLSLDLLCSKASKIEKKNLEEYKA